MNKSKVEGFDDVSIGQLKAICIKLGGMDNMNAILRNEMSIELKGVVYKLIDKNGRIIPMADIKSSVCDPDKKFHLVQPEIDYTERMERIRRFFPEQNILSEKEFQTRSEALIEQLKQAREASGKNGGRSGGGNSVFPISGIFHQRGLRTDGISSRILGSFRSD
ncbi:MAG: hypothetical protein COU40_02370 [Candidatus Moranbacteria bacterium CG10_big_fil_rev_8_21_14_0_10_35_21]|nr:MAG: hypothetical protein COU40_02370 [Candidatus Moranbacteria bacterium CG10_big_fil_rev_8_21_14_0_10_35_21]PJA88507.1 MAG: hypothetical protein CO139_02800 [Candidatus Moranbacteria bacterium CG_4_9_14_3_um_filter_36_9]